MNKKELVTHFHEKYFIPKLNARDREGVLEELVNPLLEQGVIKNQIVILETLKKRETLGSTGIGRGVAIPHCRTLAISELYLVIGFSEMGISYDAPDKKDVKLFFLIVAPPHEESNLYLPFLGKIVEMLRSKKILKALLNTESYSSFVQVFTGD